MAGNTSVSGATVTSRVLALLGAFDARHRELSLSDLARRSGVPLATAHRLAAELAEWGALHKTGEGKYVVGRRLWDIGLLAPVARELREVAIPFLHDLYGATLETVHLAVREDDHVLYLETLSGSRSVPVVSTVGSRLPMHATGVGKVLLAYAPDDVPPAGPGRAAAALPPAHDHLASPAGQPAGPGARRWVRHDRRGDDLRRSLGRRPDRHRRRRGRCARFRRRRPAPVTGQASRRPAGGGSGIARSLQSA